jgi:hypothetical protein
MLDPHDPFEIDSQRAHLFKHPELGEADLADVWQGERVYYEADPPADWLLLAEVPGGDVLAVPLCPGSTPFKARPIGVYKLPRGSQLDTQYRLDRRLFYG